MVASKKCRVSRTLRCGCAGILADGSRWMDDVEVPVLCKSTKVNSLLDLNVSDCIVHLQMFLKGVLLLGRQPSKLDWRGKKPIDLCLRYHPVSCPDTHRRPAVVCLVHSFVLIKSRECAGGYAPDLASNMLALPKAVKEKVWYAALANNHRVALTRLGGKLRRDKQDQAHGNAQN